MAQGTVSTIAGVELEYVLPEVDAYFAQDSTLLNFFDSRLEDQEVSMRDMRIPIRIQGGIPFAQVDYDGGDLGIGGEDIWDNATLSPVVFDTGVNLTALARAATNNNKKAVQNVLVESFKSAKSQLRSGCESLLNSDGSGTIGYVISTNSGANIIGVNNPANFAEGSNYQSFYANGALSGVFEVITVSPEYGLVVNAIPAGTSVNQALVVSGASGAAGSSLFGLEYHNVDTNIGSWMGLSRATYPYKLIAPHVAAGYNAISTGLIRQIQQEMKQTLGVDSVSGKSLVAHCGVDQTAAFENASLAVSIVNLQDVKGDSTFDLLKANLPKTIGGIKCIESIHAVPGRVDFLNLSKWGLATVEPEALFEIGGQTEFQLYAASGGLAAAQIFYYVRGFQVWTKNIRANGFLSQLAIPQGYNLFSTNYN